MSDLVERLRKLAERERPYGSLPDTLDEAADRIEQLEAALREIADHTTNPPGSGPAYGMVGTLVRTARAALEDRT